MEVCVIVYINYVLLISFIYLLDEVTRDYVPSVKLSPLARVCCFLPWKPYSLTLDDSLWNNVGEFVCPAITVCLYILCVHVCVYRGNCPCLT